MRTTWPLVILFLLLFLPLQKPESTHPDPQKNNLAVNDWEENVYSDLSNQEYHIRYSESAHALSSPNRARNLRVHYTPTSFQIQPRISEGKNWKAKFNLKGIYKGSELAYAPDIDPVQKLDQHQLTFQYAAPFEVEYLNDDRGMRQNFIVNERPDGNGDLRVHMEINSDLHPVLKSRDDLVLAKHNLTTGALEPQAWYKDLKVWDAQGTALAAHMELSREEETHLLALVVEDEDAVYPVTIDPISTGIADTELESNQTGAQFGISVASAGDVNGDGYSDMLVGANAFDNGTLDEGAVFVYLGSPSGVSTSPDVMLESDQNGCNFGLSVATAGDVNGDGYADVIVGSPTWTNGQLNEGAIWIYHGSASGLSSTASAFLESDHVQGHLGFDVDCAGDINNDGYSDVVVGAPYWNGGLNNEGKFFVYMGSASGLQLASPVAVESNQLDAEFGGAVSAAGDVNGDGYSDVIIGAYLYDNGQVDEGAAFIYLGSSTGLQVPAADTLENDSAGSWFGFDVTNVGDVNGDGFAEVGMSALMYSSGQMQEGAVYVYEGSASGVESAPSFAYESNMLGGRLGNRVSSCGDMNGDGYADFMATTIRYTNPSPSEGAVYFFEGSANGLNPTPVQVLESNQNSANMGSAAACVGDVNGDGLSDVAVGVFLYDNPEINEGVVWVYHGATDGLSSLPSLLEVNQPGARMGQSGASAGDVNGDGYDDLVIGADLYDNPTTNQGAAFVYYGSESGVSNIPDAILQGTVGNARFGSSVDAAGDVNGDGYADIIIGAPSYTGGQVGEGAVYIFHGSASGINTTPAVVFESNVNGAQMGNSVAGIGDVNGDGYADVAWGGWFYDGPLQDEGKVWVHHGSPLGVEPTPALEIEGNQVQAFMGTWVAGAGDVNGDGFSDFMASAYRYDNGQTDEGGVWMYHGSPGGLVGPVQFLEANQADSRFGTSISTAGDVNGDGYSDILVGAESFDNGQTNEGVVHVYYGSASGIPATANLILEENQSSAYFGHSVASAGDVNMDGYADVIVGAYQYDNGETNEGMVFTYHGSPSGLSATSSLRIENDQSSSNLGTQVAPAGDLNGDGYSEIVVGARGWDGGQLNEGGAFIYFGNQNDNRMALTQQYLADLTTPLDNNGYLGGAGAFGIGQFAFSHTGRVQGKLVWEKVQEGQPFSGTPVSNGVNYSDESVAWTDLGITGREIKEPVTLLNAARTRWRVRVKYHPAKQVDGQVYSRWFYGTQSGVEDIGLSDFILLPVELTEFTAEPQGQDQVRLNWTAASETGLIEYKIERSRDGATFEEIGTEPAIGITSGKAAYEYFDEEPFSGVSHYRLRMETVDGQTEYSEIETVFFDTEPGLTVYPNPVAERLFVQVAHSSDPMKVTISDIKGVQVFVSSGEAGEVPQVIEMSHLDPGVYIVQVVSGRDKFAEKVVVR